MELPIFGGMCDDEWFIISEQELELTGTSLGSGGYGEVVLGKYRGREVAVKRTKPESPAVPASAEQQLLRWEAQVLRYTNARCRHTVRLLGVVPLDGGARLALVMPRHRRNLQQYVKAQPGRKLPPLAVIRLARSLLRVLAELHWARVVMGDLKPANVLLEDDDGEEEEEGAREGAAGSVATDPPQLLLCDFGLARFTDRDDGGPSTDAGSVAYMAPELFGQLNEDGGYAARTFPSDMWALGCTLLFALTGSEPWRAELSACDILFKVLLRSPDIPQAGVPRFLRDLLAECFQRDPAQRPTASDALTRVVGFLRAPAGPEAQWEQLEPAEVSPPPPVQPARPQQPVPPDGEVLPQQQLAPVTTGAVPVVVVGAGARAGVEHDGTAMPWICPSEPLTVGSRVRVLPMYPAVAREEQERYGLPWGPQSGLLGKSGVVMAVNGDGSVVVNLDGDFNGRTTVWSPKLLELEPDREFTVGDEVRVLEISLGAIQAMRNVQQADLPWHPQMLGKKGVMTDVAVDMTTGGGGGGALSVWVEGAAVARTISPRLLLLRSKSVEKGDTVRFRTDVPDAVVEALQRSIGAGWSAEMRGALLQRGAVGRVTVVRRTEAGKGLAVGVWMRRGHPEGPGEASWWSHGLLQLMAPDDTVAEPLGAFRKGDRVRIRDDVSVEEAQSYQSAIDPQLLPADECAELKGRVGVVVEASSDGRDLRVRLDVQQHPDEQPERQGAVHTTRWSFRMIEPSMPTGDPDPRPLKTGDWVEARPSSDASSVQSSSNTAKTFQQQSQDEVDGLGRHSAASSSSAMTSVHHHISSSVVPATGGSSSSRGVVYAVEQRLVRIWGTWNNSEERRETSWAPEKLMLSNEPPPESLLLYQGATVRILAVPDKVALPLQSCIGLSWTPAHKDLLGSTAEVADVLPGGWGVQLMQTTQHHRQQQQQPGDGAVAAPPWDGTTWWHVALLKPVTSPPSVCSSSSTLTTQTKKMEKEGKKSLFGRWSKKTQ